MMTLLQSGLTAGPTIHNMENLRHFYAGDPVSGICPLWFRKGSQCIRGRKNHGNGFIFPDRW